MHQHYPYPTMSIGLPVRFATRSLLCIIEKCPLYRSIMKQLTLFGVAEVQTSTCQVPVDKHSILSEYSERNVTGLATAVYLYINEHSNWKTGQSHGLSYSGIAEDMHIPRSQVIQAINYLVESGWLKKSVRNKSKAHHQNTANTYLVIHHKCAPEDVPLDKDGCPKKCAMPRGEGSPTALLKDGQICWQEWLYCHILKANSDWKTGVVEMTIKQAKKVMRFSVEKICAFRKSLERVGLLETLSKPFRAWVAQLRPAPYEKRRNRRWENPKGMPCDSKYWYSFNKRWRVSREDGHIQTLLDGTSKWRHANEFELESSNAKIYKDFKPIVELVTSPYYQKLMTSQ